MKYIMFENDQGSKIPVMFPDEIVHSDFAEYIQHYFSMNQDEYITPVSAGFVTVSAHCSGKSETLELQSHVDDSMHITFHDGLKGQPLELMPDTIVRTLKNKMKELK
jgi:hypothetical protein